MIEVSKEQLKQVEYLIEQSVNGNHILFTDIDLKEVFRSQSITEDQELISIEQAYKVEHHIEKLILQPTLEQKRSYLDQLDRDTYHLIIKTYFSIVENNIYENLERSH